MCQLQQADLQTVHRQQKRFELLFGNLRKNAAETVGQVNRTLEERRRTGAKTRLRAIILLIIIVIIAAAASWYYKQNKSDVDRLMRETGTKIEKNVQETKATIQQGVPTSSQYNRNREAMVE